VWMTIQLTKCPHWWFIDRKFNGGWIMIKQYRLPRFQQKYPLYSHHLCYNL
jgi:hypothetical protein